MTSRFKIVVFTGLLATFGASAGQIQVGGSGGLSTAYIGSGNLNGWSQKSFSTSLFQNAVVTPTPGQVNTLSGSTMTDANGVVFNMIGNGSFLASPTGSSTSTSLFIPISGAGLVGSVDILLNDYAGFMGSNPTITFNFATPDVDVIPDLANGLGGIRSAVNCLATSGSGTGFSCPNPSTMPAGSTVSSSSPTTKNKTILSNGDQVATSAIWSGTYSIAAGANGTAYDYFYNQTEGSSGNVMLDELSFSFAGTNVGALTGITITPSGTAGVAASRLALSAITLVTVPEPSTILLFATGLGLLGCRRLRGRKV